jgi:hypothetical protein
VASERPVSSNEGFLTWPAYAASMVGRCDFDVTDASNVQNIKSTFYLMPALSRLTRLQERMALRDCFKFADYRNICANPLVTCASELKADGIETPKSLVLVECLIR